MSRETPMDGTAELRQLANLLRVGAGAAREIAAIRNRDRAAIDALADQAIAMAISLDKIASREIESNSVERQP